MIDINKEIKDINAKIDKMFLKIDCMCDPDPEKGILAKLFKKSQDNENAIKGNSFSIKFQYWLIGFIFVSILGIVIEKALRG